MWIKISSEKKDKKVHNLNVNLDLNPNEYF
jgi:hypothetical protein